MLLTNVGRCSESVVLELCSRQLSGSGVENGCFSPPFYKKCVKISPHENPRNNFKRSNKRVRSSYHADVCSSAHLSDKFDFKLLVDAIKKAGFTS